MRSAVARHRATARRGAPASETRRKSEAWRLGRVARATGAIAGPGGDLGAVRAMTDLEFHSRRDSAPPHRPAGPTIGHSLGVRTLVVVRGEHRRPRSAEEPLTPDPGGRPALRPVRRAPPRGSAPAARTPPRAGGQARRDSGASPRSRVRASEPWPGPWLPPRPRSPEQS